jgi:hypothetical protein
MNISTYLTDLTEMFGSMAVVFSPFLIALFIRKVRSRKGLG